MTNPEDQIAAASRITAGCFPGNWIRSSSLRVTEGPQLPRWSVDRGIYHISLHQADSIPAVERQRWIELREELKARVRQEARALSEDERELLRVAYDERIERYLRTGAGSCLLADARSSEALAETLEQANGKLYALHRYVVMPNHLHVIAEIFKAEDLDRVVQGWKRVSSHRINRCLARTGKVWMEDAYTRIIRTAAEYERQMAYVWQNPEAAGLTGGFRRKDFS